MEKSTEQQFDDQIQEFVKNMERLHSYISMSNGSFLWQTIVNHRTELQDLLHSPFNIIKGIIDTTDPLVTHENFHRYVAVAKTQAERIEILEKHIKEQQKTINDLLTVAESQLR